MKKLILLLFAGLLVWASCDNEDNESCELEVVAKQGNIFDSIVMNGYYFPTEMALEADEHHPYLYVSFESSDNPVCGRKSEDQKRFLEYSKYYGDTCYTGRLYMSHYYLVSACVLKSLDVKCLGDYDDEHKAGSSVNDIINVNHRDIWKYVSNSYEGKGYYDTYNTPLTDYYDVKLCDYQFALGFSKSPSVPGTYEFTVSMEFYDDPVTGEKVTLEPKTVSVTFE